MKRKICRGGAVKAEGMAMIFNTLLRTCTKKVLHEDRAFYLNGVRPACHENCYRSQPPEIAYPPELTGSISALVKQTTFCGCASPK
jgi:hypothetical protein